MKKYFPSIFITLTHNIRLMISTFFKYFFVFFDYFFDYLYDMLRYMRKLCISGNSLQDLSRIEAQIQMSVHTIERGLSLSDTRKLFGIKSGVLDSLIELLDTYKEKANANNHYLKIGVASLIAYEKFHDQIGITLPNDLKTKIMKIKESLNSKIKHDDEDLSCYAGYKLLNKEDIIEGTHTGIGLITNRYSIRSFSEEEVDIELINKAYNICDKSSFCL